MKYVVILGDGMADYPVESLGGKTPLEVAKKPNIDSLCKRGVIGLTTTVPSHLSPGSDVANLSAMGYDPDKYYSGRSPLEAVSIGVDMKDSDVVFRANIITVSDDEVYEDKTIIDHSSGSISNEEAKELIEYINKEFQNERIKFYNGVSYRHALVIANGSTNVKLTPPHDILDKKAGDYMPEGDDSDIITYMMKRSYELLKDHPVNIRRMEKGLNPANSLWIWGEGTKPALDNFKEKFGVDGSVISAVDLIKGIAICAGLESVDVEGVNGDVDTNWEGKAQACIDSLKSGKDFCYVHMEAPDECGHRGETENKIKSIELIDEKVVGYVKNELDKMGEDYRILIMPDHSTPIKIRTHTRDAIPFVLYDSTKEMNGPDTYTEKEAEKSGLYIKNAFDILPQLLFK